MAQFIPTAEEKLIVNKIRDDLADISDWQDLKMDAYILRWLKAKDMKVEKAIKGLRGHYKFRQELGLDTILTDYKPDPEIVKLVPYEIVGFCKDGCPILVADCPKLDPAKVIKKFGKEPLIRYGEYVLEKVTQVCRDRHTDERPVQQVVAIGDAKNFSFKQLTSPGALELGLEQLKRIEPQFPDVLRLGVAVNAPKVAKLVLKICKPFVPERTLRNVKLYPKMNAKVTKFLLEYIDIEELPEKYGGKKKVGGTADINILNDDEDITGNPDDLEDEEMTEIKVGAGKKLKLEYQVTEPKTQICWSFQTDDRDIGFVVYREEKEEIIVPYEKFGSLALQNSSIVCEKPGKYTLCFNNKENRFRSVHLNYIVSVFPPGADDLEDV